MPAGAQAGPSRPLRIDSLAGLKLESVTADVVTYRGKRALHLVQVSAPASTATPAAGTTEKSMAIVLASDLKDGVIEADVASVPRAGATETARGFVGIAFRIQPDASKFECIYLRPTNGRADDQLRRNHATQYISSPDFPWQKLRQENPGVYESYVDLVPGEWTHMKIELTGTKARLYVNGAAEPVLIVNDLKLGPDARGRIALWAGSETEAWFSNVTVR
jgi:3-keto-disaccharide hydrolase